MLRTSPLLMMLPVVSLLAACGPATRLVPRGGQLAATTFGTAARLRVYYAPPVEGLTPPGTVTLYVELRNIGTAPVRVAYGDLYLESAAAGRVDPLRPGDVFRPSRYPPAQRHLLASVLIDKRGGAIDREARSATPAAPPWEDDGEQDVADFLAPAARSRINGPWTSQNDLGTGPQLSFGGWPFFGLPPVGKSLSLFDLLVATLPEGELAPGTQSAGFLFFPRAQATPPRGLRWRVSPKETLAVPLTATR